jgi:hypothetical protein
MKIFISWSGARSRELAVALRDWLRLVLQYAEPWVSEKDISAGDRWAQTIAGALESSNFGIICITPENLNSQWILFEAGALSKSMLDAKVIPLLLGLELSDLGGPLAQFQAQKADESGLMEVVKAINKVSGNKAADGIIAELVPALWPKLADSIAAIPNKVPTEKHLRPQHEILEDLVTSVRGLSSQMRELDPYDETRERAFERKLRGLHPGMIGELLHAGSEGPDARGVSLLMISGMVRDSMPWPAEVANRILQRVEARRARRSESNCPSATAHCQAHLARTHGGRLGRPIKDITYASHGTAAHDR